MALKRVSDCRDTENCRIGRDAQVGAPPETAQDPDDWGVAVLGDGEFTRIDDGPPCLPEALCRIA